MSHPSPNSPIVEEVRKQVESAIAENQKNILAGIQKAVSEAVETKYKVVVAQLGTDNPKKDSHLLQIMLVVVPVLLTVGLGWWVTRSQTEITRKIDEQKQDLTTRLALTQEYQKRKLDVYQGCTKDMSILLQALEVLRVDATDQKASSDAVHDLYDCHQNNPLYVTNDVAQLLSKVEGDATAVMQKAPKDEMNMDTVERDVVAAEKRMLEELTAVTIPLNPTH
jgi:hypothetical protein